MHRPTSWLMSLSTVLLAASSTAAAGNLQCEKIIVDGQLFDLSKLGGPHSVVTSRWESLAETHFNTTYTVDICKPLKKSGGDKKGDQCPNGTRVCAIERTIKDEADLVTKVVAVAGNLENVGGTGFEYEATRLKTSDSNSDSKKEGLRLVLKGGKHPLSGPVKQRRQQQAVLEFLCDTNRTGLEGEWASEDEYETATATTTTATGQPLQARGEGEGKDGGDEDDDGSESGIEHQLVKNDTALIWDGYGFNKDKDADILRLTWHTKYACEKRDGDGGGDGKDGEDGSKKPQSWGFFTWAFILVFMGTAAYLIFGSWLNYTRYGARGWDLVPHGDTLRDVPFLLKDWTRRVLNTVQGTGNRGGYSAV
ncbi:autophagy-related protein 27 [Geosmithia morbida]|uniref:Autophagy-related protein 27 n=1 Tax=Geosmithia morbida TaxID=1094350 RepID=A0A9P4YU27_9HYPO|nr:autophagy-related protein 27 [Geosmithia morbida]KAF4121676.1 autophagy-related protein 27 [Geosmithia morbida]